MSWITYALRMKRPLIIYLDSSDYSRFADVRCGTGTNESEQTLLALSRLVQDGDVQVPFSALHVMEAAARDVNALEAATARLTAIGSLAQGNAFRGWTELPSIDLFYHHSADSRVKAIKPVDRATYNGRSTEGEWVPGLPSLFSEIGEMFTAAYRDPVSAFTNDPDNSEYLASLSREHRRKIKQQKRKPMDPNALRQRVESDWLSTYAEMRTKLPLPLSDSDRWKKFVIAPKYHVVDAYKSFRRGLSDLSSLAPYLASGENTINQSLTSWLRESGANCVKRAEQINAMRARWKNIANDSFKGEQKWRVLRDAREFQSNWLAREHSDLLKEFPVVYESYRLAGDTPAQISEHPSFESTYALASTANRALVFRSYLEVAMNPQGAERASNKHASDIGDIFHAQYIPYCDIYRCDGFASTFLKNAAEKSQTALVSSLPQLMKAIEASLRESADD